MKAILLLLLAVSSVLAAEQTNAVLRVVNGKLYNLQPLITWYSEYFVLRDMGMQKKRPLPDWDRIAGQIAQTSNQVAYILVPDFYGKHLAFRVQNYNGSTKIGEQVQCIAFNLKFSRPETINSRTLTWKYYDCGTVPKLKQDSIKSPPTEPERGARVNKVP